MKNMVHNILLSTFLILASVAFGADVAPVDVTISDPSGKLAFKGKTDTHGTFYSGNVAPGNYTVQFKSNELRHGQYAIVVTAGKKKVSADSLSEEKFSKGGIAMKVEMGSGGKIEAQVAPSGGEGQPGMVWIPKKLGSNKAAHWAPADSAEAAEAKANALNSNQNNQNLYK